MMRNSIIKWIKTGVSGVVGAVLLISMVCLSANAQSSKVLFGGKVTDKSIVAGSWGGGVVKQAAKVGYRDSDSLEIKPNGLFAGGRIDFVKPIDLTSEFNDKNYYLQIVARFGSDSSITPGFGGIGMPSLGAPPTMPGMGGMPGVMGGRGTMAPGMSTALTGRPIPNKRLQLILEFDNGQFVESEVNIAAFTAGDDGWTDISFPMFALKRGIPMDNYLLKRVIVCGDGTEVINVREIRTDFDSSVLTAYAGDSKEVAINDRVSFMGSGDKGSSSVIYSWDFDKSDGIQQEAIGEIVYHRFRQAGTFIVTLTASDEFGIKEPAVSEIEIIVNKAD